MSEEPKRYRGQRGPNKVQKPKMRVLSIRLPEDVIAYYHGSTTEMRKALIAVMLAGQTPT